MASTQLHVLQLNPGQLSPVPKSSGIELLESDRLNMYCFQSLTGIKFIIVTDSAYDRHEATCKKLYELYRYTHLIQ
jgi:trafficking protein particle complex subunit 4